MKVARALFPGKFQDGFAYRGRLVLFTLEHTLKFVELDRFASGLEAMFPQSIPIPKMLFSRNEWLQNPQLKDLIRNPNIRKACLEAASHILTPPSFNENSYTEAQWDVEGNFDFLLDLNIYNGRIYLGNENGLFSSDMDWKHTTDFPPKFEKRRDGTTLSISARFGTINVSSSDIGLYSSVDEFDVLKLGRTQFVDIAPVSVRSSWCQYQVVNYTGKSGVQIFETEHRKQSFGTTGEKEKEVLSAIDPDKSFGLAHVPILPNKTNLRLRKIPWDLIDFSFNLNQAFYLHQKNGPFCVVKIAYKDRLTPHLKSVSFGREPFTSRILSFHEVDGGVVLETLKTVELLTESGNLVRLHDKPPISIRTYPRSKSYKSLITIVDDDGVHLLSLFPDEMFAPDARFDARGKLIAKPKSSNADTIEFKPEAEAEDDEEDEFGNRV